MVQHIRHNLVLLLTILSLYVGDQFYCFQNVVILCKVLFNSLYHLYSWVIIEISVLMEGRVRVMNYDDEATWPVVMWMWLKTAEVFCLIFFRNSSLNNSLVKNRPWRPIALWDVEAPTFSRQLTEAVSLSVLRTGHPLSLGRFLLHSFLSEASNLITSLFFENKTKSSQWTIILSALTSEKSF